MNSISRKPGQKADNLAIAQSAWGENMPAWIKALAETCNETTQAAAAALVGYSPAVINSLLNRKYAANYAHAETKITSVLLPQDVACPVLGTILSSDCQFNAGMAANKDRAPSNITQVHLAQNCPACPHNPRNQET